jgi:hypothetical protein
MRTSARERTQLKLLLAGLLVALPVIVVCEPELPATGSGIFPQYEAAFYCDDEAGDVEVGAVSGTVSSPCSGGGGPVSIASAADVTVPGSVDLVSDIGEESFRLICGYSIDDNLPAPNQATCSADVVYPIDFFLDPASGMDPRKLSWFAFLDEYGTPQVTPPTASVLVDCPGGPSFNIAIGDASGTANPLVVPVADFSCDVDASITSEAENLGDTYHVLRVFVGAGLCPGCAAPTPFCGPSLTCQAGVEGDSCQYGHNPFVNELSHCDASAPICFAGACQDGTGGDLCGVDLDCAIGFTCTFGTCS